MFCFIYIFNPHLSEPFFKFYPDRFYIQNIFKMEKVYGFTAMSTISEHSQNAVEGGKRGGGRMGSPQRL